MFVSLEGPEGCGKTTQVALLEARLLARGYRVVSVHEPGGTDLGSHIRVLLLGHQGPPLDPWAEALLFSACRAQLVAEVIRPALAEGAFVVADRFADSTLAYQGAARGLARDDLDALIRIATGGLRPDVTLLLDIPADAGLKRVMASGKRTFDPRPQLWFQPSFFDESDAFQTLEARWSRFEAEPLEFHERVRNAYLDLARADPSRWAILDATQPVEGVGAAAWAVVEARLSQP